MNSTIAPAFNSFFTDTVLNPLNEYRFVSTLPSLCPPVSDAAGVAVGCAQGSLTYIVPKVFTSLTIDEKADLLIEIRLQSFPSLDDTKLQIARTGFRTTLAAYKTAAQTGTSLLWWSDQDLASINQFLAEFPGSSLFVAVQGGGHIIFDKATPAVNFNTDLKTVLLDTASSIELKGTAFHADHVELIHSTIKTFDFSGDQVLMIDSSFEMQSVHLKNANVQESNFTGFVQSSGYPPNPEHQGIIDVTDFNALHSVSPEVTLIQGSSITFKNLYSNYGSGLEEVKGTDIQLCNLNAYGNYDGDHLHKGDCNASQ
jgi:hypothetical protein